MRMVKRDLQALLLLAVPAICISAVLAAGCGGSASPTARALSGEEIWERARAAQRELHSWHMEIASYYENTAFGSGPIQSMIIEVDGDRMRERDMVLGQVYFETVCVGDLCYSKDMETGEWRALPLSAGEAVDSDTAEEYHSQFLELPSLAESHEYLGTELIEERETEHFRFILSPESVVRMFANQQSFDFSGNGGGEVEVWIDSESFFLARYVLVIRGVVIPEQIGLGDLRFVVNIRDFNQPIDISME